MKLKLKETIVLLRISFLTNFGARTLSEIGVVEECECASVRVCVCVQTQPCVETHSWSETHSREQTHSHTQRHFPELARSCVLIGRPRVLNAVGQGEYFPKRA